MCYHALHPILSHIKKISKKNYTYTSFNSAFMLFSFQCISIDLPFELPIAPVVTYSNAD